MLRPFLIIGVGGSGGKTLRAIRYELELRLQAAGWNDGMPEAWQFLHYDTPVVQDGAEYPAPFLPANSYRGLVASAATYQTVVAGIKHKIGKEFSDLVQRQLPDPDYVAVPIYQGAGQYRAVGRAIALSKLDDIANAASNSVNRLRAPSALAVLQEVGQKFGADSKGGVDPNPIVLVVSSIAGGSGAGQYIDVIEAVKSKFGATPWARESYGILYAPDVFDGIRGGEGIAANSLATVTETVSGFWNNTPSPATTKIFESQGLSLLAGDANDRLGVRYPFIVGREGANASFDGQNDVYKAISTTITAWMTDDKFQDSISAYSKTNWLQNVSAAVLPDNTGLLQDRVNQAPALSAIGFGRVTLAREKFIEYSAERFAKSAIKRLLEAHSEADPNFERMDEEEWIKTNAAKAQIAFIREAGLNEETEQNTDVIDALRAVTKLQGLQLEFKSAVKSASADPSSLDKNGGLDIDTWYNRLMTSRTQLAGKYLDEDRRNRQLKMDEWVKTAPDVLLKTTVRFAVQQGLRVTEELLSGLSESLERASRHLEGEAMTFRGHLENMGGYIYEELQRAAGSNSVREDNDAVQGALTQIENSLYWESESSLRASTAKLLDETRKELIKPLTLFVSGTYKALNVNVGAEQTADGRTNDFPFWPGAMAKTVSKKYQPSSNEKMLLEAEEFPEEFERLVSATFGGDRYGDAIAKTLSSMLEGDEGDSVISIRKTWRPVATADPNLTGANGSNPAFEMPNTAEAYLELAKDWMKRRGTPFQVFIETNMTEFFDKDKLTPDVFNSRRTRFLSHLASAFRSSTPLVKLHPSLLNEVHQKQIGEGDSIIVSALPFNKKSEMYEPTKQLLLAEMSKMNMPGNFNAEVEVDRWFREQNADSIEFFSMLGYPVHPIVVQSIMTPAASAWLSKSGTQNSRTAFWKWIRGRLLSESVPMDRLALDRLIRGWYTASALSLISTENHPELGPKITVQGANAEKLNFPHPLLYAGVPSEHELLPAVVESLIVAQALCSSKGDLSPIAPYKRLIELGGRGEGVGGRDVKLSAELQCRLATGKPLEPGSQEISFTADDMEKVETRKTRVNEYLEQVLVDVEAWIKKSTAHGSVYSYPVAWELLPEIRSALHGLNDLVASFRPETETSGAGISRPNFDV